jgi:hypothetical protein
MCVYPTSILSPEYEDCLTVYCQMIVILVHSTEIVYKCMCILTIVTSPPPSSKLISYDLQGTYTVIQVKIHVS